MNKSFTDKQICSHCTRMPLLNIIQYACKLNKMGDTFQLFSKIIFTTIGTVMYVISSLWN